MEEFSAIKKTEYINEEFKRYIRSTFQMENEKLLSQFNERIENETLVKGPFLSMLEPFKYGKSITELVKDGVLDKDLLKMSELHPNRKLYKHQEEAIRKASEGMNLVISTGTGSGKTESFLIPILDKIIKDKRQGIINAGVQALLIYPMNALANDQRERVREILKEYPKITFGFYTGETERTQKNALLKYKQENKREPLSNELISREIIQKDPPNILFTNYSMLEYILLRPYDKEIFSKSNTSHWHYIVLDEAHVYRGAQGIEISMLMRRLVGRINSKPQFILTSATLANSKKEFPAVIDFAEKISSSSFDNYSIVLGERIRPKKPDITYKQPLNIYRDFLDNHNRIKKIYLELFGEEAQSVKEMLYQIIIHDENYYIFKDSLHKPLEIKDLYNRLPNDWRMENIIDLVDCINFVNSGDNTFLIDLRYHSFVKALDGAFVTIKPEIKMYLRNTSYHNHMDDHGEIDKIKTFQMGLCKYCKAGYILGRIVGDYFYRFDDEELYETFSEDYNKQSNILLIKDLIDESTIKDIQHVDNENLLNMVLCNKCGHIHDVDNINKESCGCGTKYLVNAFMSDNSNSKNKSNLYKCISCSSSNPRGVIESFYIGKDAATAIVAQLLYKVLGTKSPSIEYKENTNMDIFSRHVKKESDKKELKKFIAFSDSRQQASFFATFFEERHENFLRKRLIIDALEEEDRTNTLNLINRLTYKIENRNLFTSKNMFSAKTQAWISILVEILDVDRKNSLSGLGLINFRPKIDYSKVSEADVYNSFDGMTMSTFKKIVEYVILSMRNIPAINYYDVAALEYNLRDQYLSYRKNDKAGLVLNPEDRIKSSVSLIPATKYGNHYTSYITRALNVTEEVATNYLNSIWYFLKNSEIIHNNPNQPGVYVFPVDKFDIEARKNVDWYVCDKCQTISSLNLNDTCPKSRCEGRLQSIDPDIYHANNFYYKEYLTKTIEPIRIEEHTGQLDKEKAREYQRDFINGDINILSSSTTFEMGVDIGNLNTVYLRNVPPTPANYVQRAGRAGRRKDSTAYILTFTSNNSHDYNFYKNPLPMIEGNVSPPYFEIKNDKIINRHILAVILSDFFYNYPKYFESVKEFVLTNGVNEFKNFVLEKENGFSTYIKNNIYENFDFIQWYERAINNADSDVNRMEKSINLSLQQLSDFEQSDDINDEDLKSIERQRIQIENEKTLNALSRFNVLPSYSFPIDTVNLNNPSKPKIDLNRDLTIAISEFAPGSEVIVDKGKYRSRYITRFKQHGPVELFYKLCSNCKSLALSSNFKDVELETCANCGEKHSPSIQRFIKPIYGFISEYNELNDKTLKPKRTYSGDYYYIGKLSKEEDEIVDVNDYLTVTYVKDNHLALLNDNPFFMCRDCGYTEIDYENKNFSFHIKEHIYPKSTIVCSNTKLDRISLGHNFRTDIIILKLKENVIEENMPISLMYAILEGVSSYFEIERRDISGVVQNIKGTDQIVLFDNVPGGAGHVKRLLNKNELINALEEALKRVSFNCCGNNTSCYNCLRTYDNEKLHAFLKRDLAKEALLGILNKKEEEQEPQYF